jgi:CHAT domain-containing protein
MTRSSAAERTARALYYLGYDSLSDSEVNILSYDKEFHDLVNDHVEHLKTIEHGKNVKHLDPEKVHKNLTLCLQEIRNAVDETQVDNELNKLTQLELNYPQYINSDPDFPDNFFDRLKARVLIRKLAEEIAEAYLSLIEENKQSENTVLKLLEILDRFRARDVAIQSMRFAPIGPHVRRKSPNKKTTIISKVLKKNYDQAQFQTTIPNDSDFLIDRRAEETSFTLWQPNSHCPTGVKAEPPFPLKPLDFSHVVLLHMGFVKDDLIIALDANTEAFLYGKDFDQNKKINSRAFCEYSYQINELSHEKLIGKAYRVKGVRTEIEHIVRILYNEIESSKKYPSYEFFLQNITKLSKLINIDQILDILVKWAKSNELKTEDICLVIAPDETLFMVPFGFLLDRDGQPLIKHFGGLSISLSLVALKYSLYRYHWQSEPFLSSLDPSCTFFGSAGLPPLNIATEAEIIAREFGEKNTFCFYDSDMADTNSTRQSFYCWHNSADIIWFAGHGSFDPSTTLKYNNEIYSFPKAGIWLSDGCITSIDLLNLDGWNFSTSWLLVFNSCLVGKTLTVNSNPLGFLSSLYASGAISSVSSLWPIPDIAAINFAENFSASILSNYKKEAFPKAAALRDTLVYLWDELKSTKSGNPFVISGYFLCGIP